MKTVTYKMRKNNILNWHPRDNTKFEIDFITIFDLKVDQTELFYIL